jgi:RNA polymerase sigma-70 factor (ECF subfamily)
VAAEEAVSAEEALSANGEDLLRYFRRRVPPEDAGDLLADTMTTAWRRARAMPSDPQAARMWLFTVAHHCLLNHHRGERRRHRLANRLRETLSHLPDQPSADAGYEIRDAIDRLDPHLAEIVRLVHWDGFTLQQVADLLELPASTVRNHYQRAKALLREALAVMAVVRPEA